MGEQVHKSPGQRWLCIELMRRVPEGARLVVIDGLRFPEDHAFFVECFGRQFLHLHIRADRNIREARYIREGRTAEDFEAAESSLTESQHDRVASMAHVILENEADQARLWEKIERAIHPRLGGLQCQ